MWSLYNNTAEQCWVCWFVPLRVVFEMIRDLLVNIVFQLLAWMKFKIRSLLPTYIYSRFDFSLRFVLLGGIMIWWQSKMTALRIVRLRVHCTVSIVISLCHPFWSSSVYSTLCQMRQNEWNQVMRCVGQVFPSFVRILNFTDCTAPNFGAHTCVHAFFFRILKCRVQRWFTAHFVIRSDPRKSMKSVLILKENSYVFSIACIVMFFSKFRTALFFIHCPLSHNRADEIKYRAVLDSLFRISCTSQILWTAPN